MGPPLAFLVGGGGLAWATLELHARVADLVGQAPVARTGMVVAAVIGAGLGAIAAGRLLGRAHRRLGEGALVLALAALWAIFLHLFFGPVSDLAVAVAGRLGGGPLGTAALGGILCAWTALPLFALAGAVWSLFLGPGSGLPASERTELAVTAMAGGALASLLFSPLAPRMPLLSMLVPVVSPAVLGLALWGAWHRGDDAGAGDAAPPPAGRGPLRVGAMSATVVPATLGFLVFGLGTLWARLADTLVDALVEPAGIPAGALLGGLAAGVALAARPRGNGRPAAGRAMAWGGFLLLAAVPFLGPLLRARDGLVSLALVWGPDANHSLLAVASLALVALVVAPSSVAIGVASRRALAACAGPGGEAPGMSRWLPPLGVGAAAGPLVVAHVLLPALGFPGAIALMGAVAFLAGALWHGSQDGWDRTDTRSAAVCALAAAVAGVLLGRSFPPGHALAMAVAVGLAGTAMVVTADRGGALWPWGRDTPVAKRGLWVAALVAVLSLAATSTVDPRLHMVRPVAAVGETLFDRHGSVSGVQVFSLGQDAREAVLVVNGIVRDRVALRGDRSQREEAAVLSGLLPLAHRPGASRAAIVGADFGVAAGTLLGSPDLGSLATIEGESAVLRGIARALESGASPADGAGAAPDPFRDPRHTVVPASPRAHFALVAPGSYDVVVSTRPDPADARDASLFTAGFFAAVSRALADDGVFVLGVRPSRMRPATLAAIMRALGDAFGEHTLFVSRDMLLVVAAKSGAELGEPPGLPPGSADLWAQAAGVGLHDLKHVMAHRVASGRLARPYFDSIDAPGPGRAARGDLLARRTSALFTGLWWVDFPMVAMMEGRDLPEPEASLERRRYTPEAGRIVYAQALWAHFLGDRTAAAKEVNPRHLLAMERLLEAGACPSGRDGWVDAMADLRIVLGVLGPALNPARMEVFWERTDRKGCWRQAPEDVAALAAYHRSLSLWDFGGVVGLGAGLLDPAEVARSESMLMVLLSMMVAQYRSGDRLGLIELMSLVPSGSASIYQEVVHFLSAGAFVGEGAGSGAPEAGDGEG